MSYQPCRFAALISVAPLSSDLVPRQSGKVPQPQKVLPALSPRLATRCTILAEQTGHSTRITGGDMVAEVFSYDLDLRVVSSCPFAALACWISPNSFDPSTRVMLRPLAKAIASSVKLPEVTTKPPAAPLAAMTP